MLEIFKKLSPKATAADLRASLAAIDIPALETAHADASDRRAKLLLTGTTAEILKAEDALNAARINLDRARAMQEELERRIAEAELRETEDAFLVRRAVVEKRMGEQRKLIRGKLADAARTIEAALPAIHEANREWWALHHDQLPHMGSGNGIENAAPVERVRDWLQKAENDDVPQILRAAIFRVVQD